MLRNNIIKPTASVLANRIRQGIGLEAVENSPIADLVELTAPGVEDELVSIAEDAAKPTPTEILQAVEKTVAPSESHALLMDSLVADGIASVSAMIDKARNVVAPAIATTVDNVRYRISCKVTPPNTVKTFQLDPLASSQTVGDLLASFKGSRVNLHTVEDLPLITGEQYTPLLETGSAETNTVLLDYLAQFPENYLNALVSDIIRGVPGEECANYIPFTKFADGKRYIRRSLDALPAMAVACIILRNLQDNPFPGTPVTIDAWNEQVTLALAGIAGYYWMLLDDLVEHVASRRVRLPTTLCEDIPVNAGEFPILDRTYDAFLENEGYPELLFAVSLETSYYSATIDSVLADRTRLNQVWAEYTEKYRMRAMSNLDEVIRMAVYAEVGALLDTIDYTEIESTRGEVWDAVKCYAEDVTFTPASLYGVVRYLFAGIIYRKYCTLEVLCSMDANSDKYGCEPRIAAYHAAKQYICQWVYNQMVKRTYDTPTS